MKEQWNTSEWVIAVRWCGGWESRFSRVWGTVTTSDTATYMWERQGEREKVDIFFWRTRTSNNIPILEILGKGGANCPINTEPWDDVTTMRLSYLVIVLPYFLGHKHHEHVGMKYDASNNYVKNTVLLYILVAHVADMSPTCRRLTTKCPNLADRAMSWCRHHFLPGRSRAFLRREMATFHRYAIVLHYNYVPAMTKKWHHIISHVPTFAQGVHRSKH